MNRSTIFVFIVCIVTQVLQLAIADDNTISVTLEIPKTRSLKSVPVYAHVHVINTGDSALKLVPGFDVIVIDAGGRNYSEGIKAWVSGPRGVRTIQSHNSDSDFCDLVGAYGKGPLGFYLTQKYLEAGSYTAQAVYKKVDGGKILSNIVSFAIDEPQGSDRDAYDMLVRATDLAIAGRKLESSDVLDSLTQKYPNSPYQLVAYLQHLQMYKFSGDEQQQIRGYRAAHRLIESYPNSVAIYEALDYVIGRAPMVVKTPKERKEFYQAILAKHPETRIGKIAKKALEGSYYRAIK